MPAIRKEETARPVEPAPSPERHPGHHPCPPHLDNSQICTNSSIKPIYLKSHLTPKGDGVG